MSKLLKNFSNIPIFGLPIDDFETFNSVLKARGVNLQKLLDNYKSSSYKDIELLFDSSPVKLNLGGETEKSRLIPTDKSNGVFDFSLALNGMYKVPEYYSKELEDKYPNLFHEFELPQGVVPNNLVKDTLVDGVKFFYYETNGDVFDCVLQQKGIAAIEQGIPNAKKKYATTNRKVYLTFKRNRGKVKYVEIYSLFYYQIASDPLAPDGDIQFAVRHLPALMLAEYLESIGIRVRFYMTRFVQLFEDTHRIRDIDPKTGLELPMHNYLTPQGYKKNLLVMPIIVKEFGQDMDKLLSLLVSSSDTRKVYEAFAEESLSRESTYIDPTLYGNPTFDKEAYLTGFARYKEKYKEYVEKGVLKTKEVLPEAMIFFHDYVIKRNLFSFTKTAKKLFPLITNEAELYVSSGINPIFSFWMKTSSKHLKHKIELINSNELRKDLANIQKEVIDIKNDFELILNNVPKQNKKLKEFYRDYGYKILQGYKMTNYRDDIDFVAYIKDIEIEITTYALNIIYPTKEETQEKMDELFININNELENFK